MKKIILIAITSLLLAFTGICYAEPTTTPTYINTIRPYMQSSSTGVSGSVLITVDSSNLCNTNNFMIDLSMSGGKEAYAAALTAFSTDKRVMLEILSSRGCTGDWTVLQSIYILK